MSIGSLIRWGAPRLGLTVAGYALCLALAASPALAQQDAREALAPPGRPALPQAFASPEAGFEALAGAARLRDTGRLTRVLGEEARRLLRSGDPVQDRLALERFAAAYSARHEVGRPGADRAVLQVGDEGWPLPIPMRRDTRGTWRFDARAGAQEILDRRIGRNELAAIGTLRAIADAEEEYARSAGLQGAMRAYARRLFSSPGTRDGLYWPSGAGEPESPLGALAAAASAGGYGGRAADDQPRPYNGYLFRILERQGPAAPGGTVSYVVNGRMMGGFAVIAWPARHGGSGIMTFIVSHHGQVYERDLGADTARIARGIDAFDPGPGWSRVAE